MSRRVAAIVIVALLLLTVAGLVVTYLQKARLAADLATSQNNLRQLAQFAAHHAKHDKDADQSKFPREIPPGAVFLPSVPPENRLSWFVPVLPGLDQRRQDIVALITQIDDTKPWEVERNQTAARTKLLVALCPLSTPEWPAGEPALTCYVGIAGLGPDAATLALPKDGRAPARAGAFRYDAATPFNRIGDGLSQTLLMGETRSELGPWLRGGPSTVRGLDDREGAKPLIGPGAQFGGYFPNGANFALCDGSVRIFTPKTSRGVLFGMATIDGGDNAPIVGE
jgi:prepilin-type processing-associated H-X9-DG protein